MTDFLKKYQKQKKHSLIWVVLASLVMAIGINIFLIDGTSLWNSLKTSVLNSQWKEINSDIYLDKQQNNYVLLSSKQMNWVKNITVSLTYNPKVIEITDIYSPIWEVTTLSNLSWVSTLILTPSEIWNISEKTSIFQFKINKTSKNRDFINMIEANFTDTEDINYNLSTSGIEI